MPLITWTDDLSVGVEQLDEDHKIIIGIINELYDAMSKGHGEELLDGVLAKLKEYTISHFYKEESLMMSYGYANYEDHKKHHGELIARLDDFMNRYKQRTDAVNIIEVSQFLREWLINHIKGDDFQYRAFFRDCGLTS